MQEAPVTHELVVSEPQKGGTHRRIVEYDFSQVDFTKPEVRQSIMRATQIILSYRPRRLSGETRE
jgi:hypothetical protein